LRSVVHALWRRRYWIVLPVLIMLPLSILAAKLLPAAYSTRALLLLQEPPIESPTGPAFAISERIEERVPGLEALLKSDRVLSRAAAVLVDGKATLQERQSFAEDLEGRLALRLVGLDMLQIELRGAEKNGLGNELREVVARFLEVLTADQSAMTAGELLIARSREQLQVAQEAHAAAAKQLSEILPQGVESSLATLRLLESRLADKDQAAAASAAGVTSDADASTSDIAQLEAQIGMLKTRIAEYQSRLPNVQSLEAEARSAEERLARLSDEANPAAYPQRLLNAPERIRIIDFPKDPLAPDRPRLLYVVFGLAASVVVGAGLAWAAEKTDPKLREPEEFAALAGVPVLGVLPKSSPRRSASELATDGSSFAHSSSPDADS
jgi:uncharacterized protein involved in exopolysaccharide biosynthesis